MPLTDLAERARFTLYTHLADTGVALPDAVLAERLDVGVEELDAALDELADAHHIVIHEGRLDTPYERRDPAAAADYFRGVGLTGTFWGLPDEPA